MALGTPVIVNRSTRGNRRHVVVDVPGDGSYLEGGSAFDAAAVAGLGELESVVHLESFTTATGALDSSRVLYDRATKALVVLTAAGAEIADETDQSALTHRLAITGTV